MMKVIHMMYVAALMAAFNASGIERITVDEVSNHYPWDGKVDCVTTVSGLESFYDYKGAFTLSVKKGGEVVRRTVTNDFPDADGVYTNTFDCAAFFGEGLYLNGGIVAELVKASVATGEPIGIIGDVLVIDVSAGSTALSYPTANFSGVDLGTFNCTAYKTDMIVLKKIPAGTYYCQPRNWGDSALDDPVTQQLTTKGFYIGVFPVTQWQYERVMGTNPYYSFSTDVGTNGQQPAAYVSWNTIRGSVAAGTAITASSDDSFLKRLVEKTGLSGFDLPTEAQWEMAARAGATAAYGAYWNGTAAVELTSSTIGEAAWYTLNSSSLGVAVGGKRPNLWGLYDMQGNIWELCRDVYVSTYSTAYVDAPCTDTSYYSGEYRVGRGGSSGTVAAHCRPSNRGYTGWRADSDGFGNTGFRLSRTLP